jgi:hypothetical protein
LLRPDIDQPRDRTPHARRKHEAGRRVDRERRAQPDLPLEGSTENHRERRRQRERRGEHGEHAPAHGRRRLRLQDELVERDGRARHEADQEQHDERRRERRERDQRDADER